MNILLCQINRFERYLGGIEENWNYKIPCKLQK